MLEIIALFSVLNQCISFGVILSLEHILSDCAYNLYIWLIFYTENGIIQLRF